MQLEIKTTIDAFNPIQVKALNAFLIAIGENLQGKLYEAGTTEIEEKPKQTRKKSEKVEVPSYAEDKNLIGAMLDDGPETIKEPVKVEAIEVSEPQTFSAPTLEDVRALVRDKIAISRDNMALIKTKLIECGSQNVSTLDAKHFQTIFDFLTEL